MGYLISCHFTQHRPHVTSVRPALPGSIGFRVYRHKTLPLFAIDTWRATKPSRYPFTAATPATDLPLELPERLASLSAIYEHLQQQGGANGLKRSYINLSAMLSNALEQPVLSVYADDDGNDFACLAEQGTLTSLVAKCGEFVVRVEPGSDARLEQEANPPGLHALAARHLQASFGIAGSEIGLGSFDPPEDFGFVEFDADA
ncbi:MAG: hypothetical protein Q8M64_04355 [Methyloversatilis sp.]|nr:hypothetical protein [Methyloversatilis sp.]